MALYIVQFTHPGPEHTLSPIERKNGIKEWNSGSHKRKFMIAEGQIVLNSSAALSGRQKLMFWGEWEPTSQIIQTFRSSNPKYLHAPFLRISRYGKVMKKLASTPVGKSIGCGGSVCSAYQNTDPFIFGKSFYYCCCKQQFKSMRVLDPGSIILFGSTILKGELGGPCFALDTVFVVADSRKYTPKTYQSNLASFIPLYYDEIMGFSSWPKQSFQYKCYKGASFNNPVNEMFSFVPCRIAKNSSMNFERVILTDNDLSIIVNNLNSAPKLTPTTNLSNNKSIWDKLCQIVRSQGFELGVNFEYNIVKTGTKISKPLITVP